ncbi:ribose-phosphate pyrophosphokinase [Kordia sp. YSTF-M3]|uniref:Ribose-phosphate pyrophosphokinase n=1 Tax=Kordia aestuariivivens TaxID=2759037 RepID=A0ABR7Q6H7_9FLAO|nr:ribose-phosphate diphosphokinase [Kordia aestuariivivens]MBC8754166.1 ribose-phosphate pyrophosphokinase [Kordia aestuariivivens]
MNYLHLDHGFTPFGKSIDFETFTFSGGEPHIKIKETVKGAITITQRITSFNDLGFILLATDALRRMNVKEINLFIPYFPAARQDRVMVSGESLSVKVYADIINSQHYEKVTVFDPHSEVTPALLNNVEVINNHEFVKRCLKTIKEEIVLISPDGGALKKIYKLSSYLGGIEVIECSKKRDVKTGQLSGFTVYADDLNQKTAVVVDDICDGGGTFLGLGKALQEKNSGDLHLIVSHGIFNKGFEELENIYKTIFTTNSFRDVESKQVVQIKF